MMPTAEELLARWVDRAARAIDAHWSEDNSRGYGFDETEPSYQRHCRDTARAALRSIASDLPTMLAEERAAGREEAARICDAEYVRLKDMADNPILSDAVRRRADSDAFMAAALARDIRSRDPRAGGEGGRDA